MPMAIAYSGASHYVQAFRKGPCIPDMPAGEQVRLLSEHSGPRRMLHQQNLPLGGQGPAYCMHCAHCMMRASTLAHWKRTAAPPAQGLVQLAAVMNRRRLNLGKRLLCEGPGPISCRAAGTALQPLFQAAPTWWSCSPCGPSHAPANFGLGSGFRSGSGSSRRRSEPLRTPTDRCLSSCP